MCRHDRVNNRATFNDQKDGIWRPGHDKLEADGRTCGPSPVPQSLPEHDSILGLVCRISALLTMCVRAHRMRRVRCAPSRFSQSTSPTPRTRASARCDACNAMPNDREHTSVTLLVPIAINLKRPDCIDRLIETVLVRHGAH